jgi:uncharacterized protein YkwD
MRLFKLNLLALALLCLVTSCEKDESFAVEEANYTIDLNLANETDWEMANEIMILVNAHRTSLGLEELIVDQGYASAYAVDHTQYMIDINKMNHDNFHIRSAALKEKGARSVGENVAYGYATAESVVEAWILSHSHRRAIEGNYTHTGLGVMQSPDGRWFYTQLFYRN